MRFQILLPEQSEDDNVQIDTPTKVVAEVIGFYQSKEGSPRWVLNPKGLNFATVPDDFTFIELTVNNKTRQFVLVVGYLNDGDISPVRLKTTSVKEVQDFPSIPIK